MESCRILNVFDTRVGHTLPCVFLKFYYVSTYRVRVGVVVSVQHRELEGDLRDP